MIFPIKIYKADGKLKKVISSTEAVKLYNKSWGDPLTLNSVEKARWAAMDLSRDYDKPSKSGGSGQGLKARDDRKKSPPLPFAYKVTCLVCKIVVMKQSEKAKYCSLRCGSRFTGRTRYNKIRAEEGRDKHPVKTRLPNDANGGDPLARALRLPKD